MIHFSQVPSGIKTDVAVDFEPDDQFQPNLTDTTSLQDTKLLQVLWKSWFLDRAERIPNSYQWKDRDSLSFNKSRWQLADVKSTYKQLSASCKKELWTLWAQDIWGKKLLGEGALRHSIPPSFPLFMGYIFYLHFYTQSMKYMKMFTSNKVTKPKRLHSPITHFTYNFPIKPSVLHLSNLAS